MPQTLNTQVFPIIIVEIFSVKIVVRNWDEWCLYIMIVEALPIKVLEPRVELDFNRTILAKSLDGLALY